MIDREDLRQRVYFIVKYLMEEEHFSDEEVKEFFKESIEEVKKTPQSSSSS